MVESDRREGRAPTFEVTIDLPDDRKGLPQEIDIDILIAPPDIVEQGLILAIATLDEVGLLVTAGAEVTVRSRVPDHFPQDQIATEEEVRAKLDEIIQLVEKGKG